jgi:hypothetical protein
MGQTTSKGDKMNTTTTCETCNGTGQNETTWGEWLKIDSSLASDPNWLDLVPDCAACGGHGLALVAGEYYTLWNRNGQGPHQRAATIHPAGETANGLTLWRVTRYDQRGPSGHFTTAVPLVELRANNWRFSKVASKMIDLWATKDKWRDGLRAMEYTQLFNALPLGVASRLCGGHDVDNSIKAMRAYVQRTHQTI